MRRCSNHVNQDLVSRRVVVVGVMERLVDVAHEVNDEDEARRARAPSMPSGRRARF